MHALPKGWSKPKWNVFHVWTYEEGGHRSRLGRNGLGNICECCGKVATVVVKYNHVNEPKGCGPHHDAFTAEGTLMTLDHLIPVSWGGSDIPRNLRTLCTKCNSARGNKPTFEEINRAIVYKGTVKDWQLFFQMCAKSKILQPMQQEQECQKIQNQDVAV